MTLLEALTASQLGHSLPIRRTCWVHGIRIQWIPTSARWKFGNSFESDLLLAGARDLEPLKPQGLLTPDSMLATDWEVVQS